MKTAIEFLIEYCDRENWSIPNNILEQAKEMEKEQIEEAFEDGIEEMICRENSHLMCKHQNISGKQYYNETFKNTNK